MTKKARIPDRIIPPPEIGARLRWKAHLAQLNARCKRDTGNTLAELLVELQIEAAHKRAKKCRTRGLSRQTVDTPAAV